MIQLMGPSMWLKYRSSLRGSDVLCTLYVTLVHIFPSSTVDQQPRENLCLI